MRKLGLLTLIGMIVFMTTNATHSQERGRFGGGGGGPGGGDPMFFFNMMAKGKDVIVRSELDQRGQFGFDMMAKNMGVSGDRITREQFQRYAEEKAKNGGFGGGRFGGGPPGGGPPGGGPPGGGFGGPPGGGPPMIGGAAPSPMGGSSSGNNAVDAERMARRERWIESSFSSADRNRDGLLDYEEMSDEQRNERSRYDTNGDGFFDPREHKEFMFAWIKKREDEREGRRPEGSGDSGGRQAFVIVPQQDQPMQEEEEKRPVVFRAGKLPKETPLWFTSTDKDTDGQISLYEWRTAGKNIREFQDMDRNGDFLLTVEETIFFSKLGDSKEKVASSQSGGDSGGRFGGGRFGGGGDSGGRSGGGDSGNRSGGDSGGRSGGGSGRFGGGR